MPRLNDIKRFYALLDLLKHNSGEPRLLSNFSDYRDWPQRGIYFFFEPSEKLSHSGFGLRLVRIGTHALTTGAKSTLRQRLSHHRGKVSGGGRHRSSIFRLLVGQALIARGDLSPCLSWGLKGSDKKAAIALNLSHKAIKEAEAPIEEAVTQYVGAMPFLHLNIDDAPGPDSLRNNIERNAIALLSNHERNQLDPPSPNWLGHSSNRPLVRSSGLWNQHYTDKNYDPYFLGQFERLVQK